VERRDRFRNRILSRLSAADGAVLSQLQAVDLPLGKVLREPGGEDKLIFFVEEGMTSATALSRQGASIEVGVIGREGVVGIGSILGHRGMPHHTVMQVSGNGYSLPTELFRTEFVKHGTVMQAVHDFIYSQLAQAAQTALCNRLHATGPRLARWLLATSDIVESNSLDLTQEFLAQMIGAERSSATIAAGILKRAGMIDYHRGHVEIVNRPMLEDAACECYGMLREEFARIFSKMTGQCGRTHR